MMVMVMALSGCLVSSFSSFLPSSIFSLRAIKSHKDLVELERMIRMRMFMRMMITVLAAAVWGLHFVV
jgi:hypothetical protein